ncbi:MAG: PQQ-binding-like beta-propeller repeat protein [Pirellulales bacterium]
MHSLIVKSLTLGLVASILANSINAHASDWPMFRGPGARSVAESANLPLEWSIADDQNIAWRADLPGRGVSSPIVVSGRVFVTCSDGLNRSRLHVVAIDAESGERIWHRQFWATGRTFCNGTSAVAAPTPASDGSRIFAYFSSSDVVALDLDGNLLWIRGLSIDFPGAGNDIGLSSSPVVAGDVVVIQSEAQGNSFVTAIDIHNGATRWDRERPQQSVWSSPIVITQNHGGKQADAVVLQSGKGVSALLAGTGELLWEYPMACSTSTSPVFDRLLCVPAGGLRALDVSEIGNSSEAVIWAETKLGPGYSSPLIANGQVFVISGAGVLTCGALESGKILWRRRLGGRFWATPVISGNYLYCMNSEGKSFVVQIDEKGRIVSEDEFGEDILASPAIANDALFVRSHKHLWKIAREGAERN